MLAIRSGTLGKTPRPMFCVTRRGFDKGGVTSRYSATCPHGGSICYRLEHKDIARKIDRH